MIKRSLMLAIVVIALVVAGCQQNQETVAPRTTVSKAPAPAKAPAAQPAPVRGSTSSGLTVVEKSAPGEVIVGQEFSYQLKASNPTGHALLDVQVTERLADQFQFKSASPTATPAGGVLTWNLGKLPPGESRTLTVTGTASGTGVLKPCSEVTCRLPQVCTSIRAVQPRLQIAKTGPAEVMSCEPITFEIVVRNAGTGAATNVVVTDTLPDGLVAIVKGKETNKVTGKAPSLAPGAAMRLKIDAKATKTGSFINKATATADGNVMVDTTHRITVRQPVLGLAKTGPPKRYLDRNATYTITVTNKGGGEARKLMLVDTLPAGMKFASASDGGKLSGGKVTWSLGTLAPGKSAKVMVTAKAARVGTMRNTVLATAHCARSVTAEATTRVEGIPAILLEVVDVEDPIEVGSNVTYRIEVTNQGSAVGTNIRISCTLPPQQQYVSSTGQTKATVVGQKVTFAPLPSLAAKDKTIYTVVVKGAGTGDVRFAVEMKSDQMTSPVNETESTHIYE